MFTISNILQDIQRGIFANNMVENMFTYRIIYFVNENGIGRKYYIDVLYENLRRSLENIIRGNLTTTNNIVIAATTTLINGKTISLLSRSYVFCLDDYFRKLNGEYKSRDNYGSTIQRKNVSII